MAQHIILSTELYDLPFVRLLDSDSALIYTCLLLKSVNQHSQVGFGMQERGEMAMKLFTGIDTSGKRLSDDRTEKVCECIDSMVKRGIILYHPETHFFMIINIFQHITFASGSRITFAKHLRKQFEKYTIKYFWAEFLKKNKEKLENLNSFLKKDSNNIEKITIDFLFDLNFDQKDLFC